MAAPTTLNTLSIESLHLATFDDHLSRWCSSCSLSSSSSSSTSRSTSSAGFPDCPTMSKSFTDSMSSDTQTENETPPESPNEDISHLQTTPVFRDAKQQRSIAGHPRRPDLPAYLSMYSESGSDFDGSDAGYETECEDRHPIIRMKRPTKRRKALDRTTFRRLAEMSPRRPASEPQSRKLPGDDGIHAVPSAPLLESTPRIAGQSASPRSRRGSISRPGGPNAIALPETLPPVFPSSGNKATVGLGLGLGLPSSLSAVRSAPNCAHRSSDDPVPSPMRSLVPVTHADLLSPLDPYPLPPTPLKPRLNPISPCPAGELSPLDLASSPSLDGMLHSLTNGTTAKDSGAARPRHAAFCFSHGNGKPTDFCTSAYGSTAAAFLTMANHAQTQQIQLMRWGSEGSSEGSRPRRRTPNGPPSRGSPLPSMQEEVCPGDEARGIRRFAAMNPYFASMGYCVSSG